MSDQLEEVTSGSSESDAVAVIRDLLSAFQTLRDVNPNQDASFLIDYLDENLLKKPKDENEPTSEIFGKICTVFKVFKTLSSRLTILVATPVLIKNLTDILEPAGSNENPRGVKVMENEIKMTQEEGSSTGHCESVVEESLSISKEKSEGEKNAASGFNTALLTVKTPETMELDSSNTGSVGPLNQSDGKCQEEKSFKCSYCSKQYKRKGNLQRHENVHTRQDLFSCTLCQREFTNPAYLEVHIRSHTGEKPYACKFCRKKFSTDRSCSRHESLHTHTGFVHCPICRREFSRKVILNKHLRTHRK